MAGGGKVGHCGTLDPFATGLLIVLCGALTRAASYFTGMPKRYRAALKFGIATDTGDCTGTETGSAAIPAYDQITAVLPSFAGAILQTPHQYSAVKVDGRRSYENARMGVHTPLAARPINIYDLSVISWEPPFLEIDVACSAGTYIRQLAVDIAEQCGSAAHLTQLDRTGIGNFSVDSAVSSLDDISTDDLILPQHLPELSDRFRLCVISPADARAVRNGVAPERLAAYPEIQACAAPPTDMIVLVTERGDAGLSFAAVCVVTDGALRYLCVEPEHEGN